VAASILVDSVAGLLQKLEGTLVKLQTLDALLVSSKGHRADTLVHAIARKDTCTAETDADMSILYELARSMRNFKEQLHDWQSNDGRELGRPTKKTFTCKLEQPRTQAHRPSAVTTSGTTDGKSSSVSAAAGKVTASVATTAVSVPILTTGAGNERAAALPTATTVLTANSPLTEIFLMEATVEQDLLRLALRVPES
jgi:cell wall assembly regulator SMI1